ncbi:hypothetical protein ASF01_13615 [Stenotrophomonas sp. Leaf70]|uniref:DUF262 domain-containing protein n=1 Tax=Stenotrophomonas sp. Leaf70 TaxID=1736233 RepID=UPI0006F7F4E6|nr:DUF262 domain-containing protein [Stenotrophomonas sp. Leaf70]KQN96401.1 hypothetical protein ASF01_13615 [Stenotrophomonas sp. Leaf70]
MRNERNTIWKIVRGLNDAESNGGLWLPNIQRPFVWSEEQIEKLFDSIMREYPISTLLVWRTREKVKHRKFITDWKDSLKVSDAYVMENADAKGMVLDGQQRLQSLIIGLAGSYNGKELHFDVLSGAKASPEDIRYRFRFLPAASAQWPWVKFKDVLKDMSRGRKLAMEVAQDVCAAGPAGLSDDDAKRVQKNIARAQHEFISDENISYQLLDGVDDPDAYTTEDVVEIFIRANSGGTKLGKSDLLFSLLASEWALADEEMEELLEELNRTGYGFDRDFVLKSCLVMLGQGAKYEVTKFRKPEVREAFVKNWTELSDAIKAVRDFLHGKTFLKSDKAVPSYLGLIPLIYLRYTYPDQWNATTGREDYVLRTMLTGAFSGTPDNLIDRCVKSIDERKAFELDEIFHIIRSDGRSLEVTPETIIGTRYGKPQSHLIFNLWYRTFDYEPALEDNLPQQDHIFPQSFLNSQKELNPQTGRSRKMYWADEQHQIANLALLTAKENGFQGKSGELPETWIPKQIKDDSGFLDRHLIPKDPELWKSANFRKFIEARKALILERFKPYLQSSQTVGEDHVVEALA